VYHLPCYWRIGPNSRCYCSYASPEPGIHTGRSHGNIVEPRSRHVECDGGEEHEDAVAFRAGGSGCIRLLRLSTVLRGDGRVLARSGVVPLEEVRRMPCSVGRGTGVALPVLEWDSANDPLALVGRMWNHIPQMRVEMAKRKIGFPTLTSQDLSDIMVYVRGLRQAKGVPGSMSFELPELGAAENLLSAHGCVTCHKGELSFDRRMANRTLTDVAVSMWNHGPKMMQNPATIPTSEMRQIVGWVWARQFIHPTGSVSRGQQVATSKKCVTCHEGGGPAPAFSSLGSPYSVIRLTSGLWRHGPKMLEEVKAKKVGWPKLTPDDVQNLIAYIDSKKQVK